MTKTMQNAIDSGTPEFRAYAEYVLDSMPDVSVPVLREMFKHNASVPEYRAHMQRMETKECRARKSSVWRGRLDGLEFTPNHYLPLQCNRMTFYASPPLSLNTSESNARRFVNLWRRIVECSIPTMKN